MPRYADVRHELLIDAPIETVRAQFADLQHHIDANVHPKLAFEVLSQSARRARYVQTVKLLGIRQRDVFEREIGPDGTIVDTAVEGFNKGGSLEFRFVPEGKGTRVKIRIRVPAPPLIGPLVLPLLERQIKREVTAAALEDKADIEQRGYRPAQRDAAVRIAA